MAKLLSRDYLSSVIVIALLFIISQVHFLLFHAIAEIFSVIIVFAVFMFTWNTRKNMKNNYLLFIGSVLIFSGFIDILHTLSFAGIRIIPYADNNVNNISCQIWLYARFIQSISFLAAPLFFDRKLRLSRVIFVYHLVIIFVVILVFFTHLTPDCVVHHNSTCFKILSELFIAFILLAALYALWRKKDRFSEVTFRLLLLSLSFMLISELFFVLEANHHDYRAIVGLLCKVIAYFLIYKAIIVVGLKQPMELLFHELNQSKKLLLENQKQLENNIEEAVCEIEEKNKMLIIQSRHAQLGEMIAAITHQWKQPLNQISVLSGGLLDAWEYDELDKEYLEKTTNRISEVVNDMNDILNDFRNFYAPQKIDTDFELSQMINPLNRLIGRRLKKYNIDLGMNIPAGLVLKGKINEIVQVMLILINNTVDAFREAGKRQGKIKILAEKLEGAISIEVIDNAGGIAAENLDNLFTPYFTTKGDKGTGMGLFLARTILEKHFNATIHVHNYQDGVAFSINIPI